MSGNEPYRRWVLYLRELVLCFLSGGGSRNFRNCRSALLVGELTALKVRYCEFESR